MKYIKLIMNWMVSVSPIPCLGERGRILIFHVSSPIIDHRGRILIIIDIEAIDFATVSVITASYCGKNDNFHFPPQSPKWNQGQLKWWIQIIGNWIIFILILNGLTWHFTEEKKSWAPLPILEQTKIIVAEIVGRYTRLLDHFLEKIYFVA